MKTLLRLGILASALTANTSSSADDKRACLDAASQGQNLRDARKLIEARQQFQVCARQQCPPMVQQDCAGWLADIERDLPSVVFTAKDSDGMDLVDVEVSVDGQVLVTKLDGRAAATNPGEHVFNFKLKDGTQRDQLVLVKEGERNQRIAILLERRTTLPSPHQGAADKPAVASAPVPVAPDVPVPPAPTPDVPVGDSASANSPGTGTWRTVGWWLGGVGVVGLGMGALSGLIAVAKKDAAHCDANNICDPGTSSGIKSAALVSDVGWVAGAVLLASGAAIVLFVPRASHWQAARVTFAPTLTSKGGGFAVGATW
jgi:hypothetical protein